MKRYLGTSENAVKIQVWTALTTYLLINYVRVQCGYEESMLRFTRMIKELLFEDVGLLDLARTELISPECKKSRKDPAQIVIEGF